MHGSSLPFQMIFGNDTISVLYAPPHPDGKQHSLLIKKIIFPGNILSFMI